MIAVENLSRNRAEELGLDLWEEFIIPPFFPRIDLHAARKPRIVLGGRGCGKTMLLRYFSHYTQFSPRRLDLKIESIKGVGLYWKIDSQYARAMFGRQIEPDVWEAAFEHYAVVTLGHELIKSLYSVRASSLPKSVGEKLFNISMHGAFSFLNPKIATIEDANLFFQRERQRFDLWLRQPKTTPHPTFLPKTLLLALSGAILDSRLLGNIAFHAYIDEYENLREYQQIILNTWLKHSEQGLIFHLAVKRNGFTTSKTHSSESISETHDYKTLDIEQYSLDADFALFAAEVLLHALFGSSQSSASMDSYLLRDPTRLKERATRDYKVQMMRRVKELLPRLRPREIAEHSINHKPIRAKLSERLKKSCEARGWKSIEIFQSTDLDPRIQVILPAVVARHKETQVSINTELQKAKSGLKNRFYGNGGWIDNMFIDSLLDLYEPFDRACPLYSGFRTYVVLAHGNLRHFLELCHKSFLQVSPSIDTGVSELNVPVQKQAEAVKVASAYLLTKTKDAGDLGNALFLFVQRLGHIYSIMRRSPSKSRSEISQFAIATGRSDQAERLFSFLNEAVKQSVIIEYPPSQRSNSNAPEMRNYGINPIFTPHFLISYRRRRRASMDLEDLRTLIEGSQSEFRAMATRYEKQERRFEEEASQGSIFSGIIENDENESL